MVKYHIGIDVSKRRHRACIHNLAQDSYSGIFSIEVNRQGFEKLSKNSTFSMIRNFFCDFGYHQITQ